MNRLVRKTRREQVAINEMDARAETAINPLRCNEGNGPISITERGKDATSICDGSLFGWSCTREHGPLWENNSLAMLDMITVCLILESDRAFGSVRTNNAPETGIPV